MSKEEKHLKCSFCGKTQDQVRRLIAGPNVYICNECVDLCKEIIDEETDFLEESEFKKLPKPKEIFEFLDKYVIKQDQAKKSMSVAVYNHYKRINSYKKTGDIEIQKSNILLIGPTGSGKTYLAQTLARMLKVPFAIADATSLTEAGYVGEDVENIILKLVQAADYDIEKAEKGIIYIDEIDKIARKGDNPSITRDVSGEGVQQGLLKLLEGSVINVPPQGGRKHPEQKLIPVDTKNILFICGGAFDGIERKIANRLNTKVIGYSAAKEVDRIERENLLQYIAPQDLKSFGLIPEIIGRLPVLTYLDPLDRDALKKILVEPKNSIIKQYKKLFKMDGIELSFDSTVLDFVVDKAIEFKLGARGLRSICEHIMVDAMYDAPSKQKDKVRITLKYARNKLSDIDAQRLKVA